jgi:hypothetical protein
MGVSSGAVPLERLVGQPPILNYAANQQQVSQIDRTGVYDYLQLTLSYTLTLAGYSAAPSIVGSNPIEQALNLIQNVTLTSSGNAAGATTDTNVNTDLLTLAVYQYYYGKGYNPGVAVAVSANGAYNFQMGVKIQFIDPWSNKSGLTRLDARLLSQLNLSVTWRDQTSQVTGGTGGTAAISAGQVVLTVREWQNVAEQLRPWIRISDRKLPITNQTNALQVQGVPIGQVLRRELLQGIVPAAAGYNYGWSSEAAFGSTGQAQGPMWQLLLNNSTRVLNSALSSIQSDNPQLLEINTNVWGSNAGAIPGWQVYEPARNKQLANAIPMWGIQRADDYIDVAAPGGNGSYLKFTDVEVCGATVADLS